VRAGHTGTRGGRPNRVSSAGTHPWRGAFTLGPCLATLLTLAAASTATAQTITDERVWFTLNLAGPLEPDSPWRWGMEVQGRTRDGLSDLDQFILRPTFGYDLDEHSSVWVGYGFITSYQDTGESTAEHRAFQQYVWTGALAGGSFGARTRLEQRDIDGNSGVSWRLRQQVRYSHALRKDSRLSIVVSDELLFNLNDTARSASGFDQHRIFGGVGYRISPHSRLEIGYLNQFVNAAGRDRMNHVIAGTMNLSL
jgi:hypothetical protein